MLIIEKSLLNQLTVTLTEKKLDSTTIYLLECDDQQGHLYYTVCQDLSQTPRCNIFCVTEMSPGSSFDPLLSEIILSLPGQYRYKFYENPNSLLVPAGLHLVEEGRLLVAGDVTSTVAYKPDTSTVVYNPTN